MDKNLSLPDSLYHQALDYCKHLEKITGSNIEKVDFDLFRNRLTDYEEKNGRETLNQLFINKSDELYTDLLDWIAYDKFQLCAVLLSAKKSLESRQKIQEGNPESDRSTIVNIYNNNQQGEHKPMTENTNNLQGANIANFANEVKDNARQQASNFTQTSGANISEILQLIGNLRQTAAQFPPEIHDDIIIDIDDVEAEIQKPEKERNLPKLKKRLLALLTAATLVAAPIAGMTDFTNNVMEIGNKLNIELKLPSGK
ncbi:MULTISPECIES: hypothetical protein [unclassified Nostoc]|uniref:hypothetical protein n=1 Tax=unclassified Nostoc TaxID=2593658 RepID=UPI00262CF265|nr:hypothetical protein [Nostoc sp. S13]MDF5737635.1 hypothetical protein [Nostoc sp. S13]